MNSLGNTEADDVTAFSLDAIEDDLQVSARALKTSSSEVTTAINEQFALLEQIGTDSAQLKDQAAQASRNAAELANSIENLTSSSTEIGTQVNHSTILAEEAMGVADDVNQGVGELKSAISDIAEVVRLISDIASQTNLLALNATIEAARAGDAGRGFAIVASEVKSLAVETQNATDRISANIERLQASSETSITSVNRIIEVIGNIKPSFAAVEEAVHRQTSTTTELSKMAGETAAFVGEVTSRVNTIDTAARQAAEGGQRARQSADKLDNDVAALGNRFTMLLRQSAQGDRRKSDRFPVKLRGNIKTASGSSSIETRDLSAGGALITSRDPLNIRPNQTISLILDHLGSVEAKVVGQSDAGLHCAFLAPGDTFASRLDQKLKDIRASYDELVQRAQTGAERISASMERLIETKRLTTEALFDTNYNPISGTNPQQLDTRYVRELEGVLPTIQEEILASAANMTFCAAVDRNGYLPVHNKIYSKPQNPEDPVWNAANCRNKRIFDDRAGLSAGRNTRPFLIQTYARDMGNGTVVWMTEVDAPILVNGRHWGGFRTAYKM
ncbi:methyl-accepting chemotaxis protein [Roseibium sediminis]|uniref:methyl-accepting chemotaxis protein n=1 Tax=Roseibium sediminis TaxID=1775174 RepID=UPI001FCB981F|nr:methyl-accepting chemotaxis protein [Roseibium sediminis]